MKNKKICTFFLCISMIMSFLTVFAEYNPDPYTQVRERPAPKGNQYTVAFIGGSLTAGGEEWIKQTAECVKARVNGKDVVTINAGKGGTGSDYGAARFMNDVGSFSPDMVVVEFAVNDRRRGEKDSKVYMESIVRQCLSLKKIPSVLFVYAPNPIDESDSQYDSMIEQFKWKDEIANHYGIKSINIYDYMQQDFKSNNKFANFEAYLASMYNASGDGFDVHGGYQKYAEAIKKAFDEDADACMAKPKNAGIYCKEYANLADARYRYIESDDSAITYDDKWTRYDVNNKFTTYDSKLTIGDYSYSYPYFENGIMQTETSATLSFNSLAEAFCFNYPSATAGSSVTVYVDNTASEQKLSCWSAAQGVNYISTWFELPKDGASHEILVVVDEPTDQNYIFRFGNIIERYKNRQSADDGNKDSDKPQNGGQSTISGEILGKNGATLYVSPDGDDEENDGTFNKPFETIQRAKEAVRALKNEGLPEGGVCVYIRGGVYRIEKGMTFGAEDSGEEGKPITYRPYQNEKVELIGGIQLSVSDFKRVSDEEVLAKIYDRDARSCIYQYDLSKIKDFNYGSIYFSNQSGNKPNELVVDGKMMTIARWPNMTAGGNDVFEKVSVVTPKIESKGFSFTLSDKNRVNNWKNAKDADLVANWRYLWQSYHDKIDNIKNGNVTTTIVLGSDAVDGTARFYIQNLIEELDRPGEFYVDKENKKLYFYPPADSSGNSEIFLSDLSDSMFKIDGANFLTFRGFTVPCSRGSAFEIKKGDNNLIAYNNITNLGSIAVSVAADTYNNGVVGNYISMTDGGINLSGGNVKTLTPGGNYAENNETEKFSRITKTYTGGIHVGGCGNRVSNNEIHDALHLGMQFSGNENIIEYNEFYDLLQSVDDSGGIYSGRTWIRRGNQITHNYFHDFYGSSGGVGLGCIYFDDNLSGNSVTKNIFENIPGRGMWAEAGSDNNVENNIMINVGTPIRYVDRGNPTTKLAEVDESNYMVSSLKEVPYTSDVWLAKYPIMSEIWNLPVYQPHRVSIKKNVFVNSGSNDISASVISQGTFENNVNIDNPGFADIKNRNYTLTENASVYSEISGFEDTHFEKMGRYTDKLKERVKDAVVLGIGRAGAEKNGEMTQIDSQNDAVMPIIINNRTFVPVRFISESLGGEVLWHGETKEIEISCGAKNIKMTVGSSTMVVDGAEATLDAAPVIRENRTLLPLRALVEALGKQVFWDDKGLIVISDNAALFDSTEDSYMIDELLRQINLR